MQSIMRRKDPKEQWNQLLNSFGTDIAQPSNLVVEKYAPTKAAGFSAVNEFLGGMNGTQGAALDPKSVWTGIVNTTKQLGQKAQKFGNDLLVEDKFKEKPGKIVDDIVQMSRRFAEQFSGKPVDEAAINVLKAGVQAAVAPFTTTAGLLKDFGRDVAGEPGGMWDKRAARDEKYGPVTGAVLSGIEGASKGAAVAAAGAMTGQAYKAWEAAGSPLGAYVEPIQKARLKDPKTSFEELLKDHDDYHRSLGTRAEGPMSKYHKDLAARLAKEKGFAEPVLDEDYENLFHQLGSKLDDMPRGKGPFREVTSKPETAAEKMAAYRFQQKRTFTIDDQWDAYKESVIKDMRRLGIDEERIATVKDIARYTTPRENFAQYLYKSADLPATAKPILEAWQREVTNAYVQFQNLSRGADFTRAEGAVSPVAKMESKLFASSRSANSGIADTLRETASLYEGRGDMGRATAYNRAADLITSKGSPNLVKLVEKGGADAVKEAFKGQGGIGSSMAQHIEDIVSEGTFPELKALKFREQPVMAGPGAASKMDDFADDIQAPASEGIPHSSVSPLRKTSIYVKEDLNSGLKHGSVRMHELEDVIADYQNAGKDVPDELVKEYVDAMNEAKRFPGPGAAGKRSLDFGQPVDRLPKSGARLRDFKESVADTLRQYNFTDEDIADFLKMELRGGSSIKDVKSQIKGFFGEYGSAIPKNELDGLIDTAVEYGRLNLK